MLYEYDKFSDTSDRSIKRFEDVFSIAVHNELVSSEPSQPNI